jgi:flagellar motor switch protein FliN
MPESAGQVKRFCKMWAESIAASLTSYGVTAPAVSASEPMPAPAPTQEEFGKLVCIRFTCEKAAKGELLWVSEKAGAMQIAKLLTGSAEDSSTELSQRQRDAFAEFLRKAAAQATASWKSELGLEIDFLYQATAVPAPVTAQCATLTIRGENFKETSLRLFLEGALNEALAALPLPEPASPTPPPRVDSPPGSAEGHAQQADPKPALGSAPPLRTEPLPANLGLVLDVVLEATIRFGEREMLLRDIFGLMAGAVVELDQMVNEPAELHVAGRMVARGEVVVVDGNFGLRVTEVVSINERVAAINNL